MGKGKNNSLNQIPSQQMFYLVKQFNKQQQAENHVSVDFLPYTSQIKWITAEMLKKFPKSPWTDKLVHRSLIRMRKADCLDKNDQTEILPVFAPDDDVLENATVVVECKEAVVLSLNDIASIADAPIEKEEDEDDDEQ